MFPKRPAQSFGHRLIAAFSILNRIDVPETGWMRRAAPVSPTFSILNRIDVPETIVSPVSTTISGVFQHPQSDRCSRNPGPFHLGIDDNGLSASSIGSMFPKPLVALESATCPTLSASSIGSMFPKQDWPCPRAAQAAPFSILNRIDVPETSEPPTAR